MVEDTKPILYGYWRSGCSWRVRTTLNLLGIEYEHKGVHLVKDGGEQHKEEYKKLNPFGKVPALVIDGHTLSESLPIIEYLCEREGNKTILPEDRYQRFQARRLAEVINSGTQPIENLSVL